MKEYDRSFTMWVWVKSTVSRKEHVRDYNLSQLNFTYS